MASKGFLDMYVPNCESSTRPATNWLMKYLISSSVSSLWSRFLQIRSAILMTATEWTSSSFQDGGGNTNANRVGASRADNVAVVTGY